MAAHKVTEHVWRLVAVDDEPLNAELIARNARKCGYETRTLDDPRELPELIASWVPDVVTLDLRMPGGTGSDAVHLLKSASFQGHIIIISGLGLTVLDAVRKQAEAAGIRVAGEMQKPVNLRALRALLGEIARTLPQAALP
jgi:two-component system response regulator RegA